MGKAWDGDDIVRTMQSKLRKTTERTDGFARHDGAAFAAGTYDLSASGMLHFQKWTQDWAEKALRVLKPGGHLLSFSSPRTYHRMTVGIEDAGFEIRDQIMWVFGSGFPKNLKLGNGQGTALKPAHEPIVVARKPFKGPVKSNVALHRTGAINIDVCRTDEGRWPANVIHDGSEEVVNAFPNAAGQQADISGREPSNLTNGIYGEFACRNPFPKRSEFERSAARFFYCPKVSKADREEGLQDLELRDYARSNGAVSAVGRGEPYGASQTVGLNRISQARNIHPTVKPTALMRYLCRLVTPTGGLVLDPFMGSGSTGKAALQEGLRFIGIEREAQYFEIAQKRVQPFPLFGGEVKCE
ncbi:DNA-methyltransferase [Rhizobium phaseoli]|uniref:DNA-methyltransferase n=1 Tax=Rhizobium phaseoli TaxID=396 RepID=UPI000B0C9B18|nr:site-specific DNA-methyltransferase [Rhizobium phaseoli]